MFESPGLSTMPCVNSGSERVVRVEQKGHCMIEGWIKIKGEHCLVCKDIALKNGMPLDITPFAGVWLSGQYGYDAKNQEHYWKSDDEHFVGLISGMKVRSVEE